MNDGFENTPEGQDILDELWLQMIDQVDRKTVVTNDGNRSIIDSDNYSGRPVLGKIVVLARSMLQDFQCQNPWACISITDPDIVFPRIDEENRVDMLQLDFDDVEFRRPGRQAMNADQALEVWDFAERVWDNIELLMIHCNAGVSRSPAIAKAISEVYQPDYAQYFDQLYSPNRLVYTTLREARLFKQT